MSTVAPRPPAPPANSAINPALLDSERYIDDHIGRTRRALKLADFSAGVIILVAGVLAFLLVAGVIDHWIIPGGLGPAGRIALFGLLVLGVGWHAWRRFVPLLRSINPVYAAHTIEKSSPTLKNSLLNVILFRGHRQQMSAKVFHALEQQAAQRLSAAPAEGSVDHAALLRLGYALLAVVAACTLYAVLSPKNLAVSAIRIIDPWADVAAPSRVKILNIEPGETSVARGERVAISAEVHAIGDDELVRLRYSTDDEQLVDESITMTRPAGATRFTADLPRATDSNRAAGVMNNLEYWIEAGDARSPRFKLSVFDRPTIVVQRVEYHAPAYTGESSRTVDNVGDIRGLEGTTVAIEALANQSIRTAYVDFDADGTNDFKMAIDGERATAGFELKLRPDRRTPLHESYVLRYTTTEGRSNSDPAQYSIDVTPDYAPEVRLTKPEEPEVTLRVCDTVQLGAEARDPDYALAQVRVMGRVGEKELTVVDLPLKDGRGRFTGSRMFTPADAGLKAGDVLEYWAEARDNRRPEANIGMSEHRRMRIVAADAPGGAQQQQNNRGGGQPQQGEEQNQEQGGQNGQGGQQGGAQQQGEEAGGEGEAGGQGEEGQQGGAAGGQGESEQAQDSNSGEAASAAGQSGGENSEAGAEGGQSTQGGAQGENEQQANQQEGGAEGTEGAAGDQQSQQENGQAGENSSGGQPGENGAAGGAQGGQQEKVSADGDDDPTAMERIREHLGVQEGESGSQAGEGQQQPGGQQAGELQPGELQPGEQQTGDQQAGAQQPGEQQNAAGENQRPGESGSDAERRGANANPNDQSANPSAGELADGKPGEGEAATEQGQPGANGSTKPSGDGAGNSEGAGETPAGADGALNENNGKSPAGDDASGAPGAPDATTKRDRDGKPGDEGESAAEGEAPTDDARGKNESHARGDQSGDRSGSGQKGGGQQAENAGQGEAGSHTASDTGAGQSEDQGAGETGTEAGDEQLADGKTGQSSGDKPGAGSESGDAEGEQQPSQGGNEQAGDEQSAKAGGEQQQGAGGQQGGSSEQQSESAAGQQGEPGQVGQAGQNGGQSAGDEAQGEAQGEQQPGAEAGGSPPGEGASDPSESAEGDQQGAGRGGAASAPPTHGGTQGGGVDGPGGGGEPGGDKANLDFARKQMDLVLEKLDDQLEKHKVDPKLLKSLGWTEDELRRFVTRWQGLKARAAEGSQDASAELDAALRSLGLRQNGPQRFRAGATADKLRDLNDAYRARAPQEYMDRVREYTKGVSAAEEE